MHPNPFLGVVFHWLGGFASGSFYVPFRFVKRWSWETSWVVGGVFSWIFAPWLFAFLNTNDLVAVLSETPSSVLAWCFFFGVLWGFGGLTFGLTMRYLGMSLGMAVALGYCAAFGTLIPPIFEGKFGSQLLGTTSGQYVLAGVAICLVGIAIAGLAGKTKESEMPEEQKKMAIREFDFKKGILVATFCGVMSACFAFGLSAGDPIKAITLRHGTAPLWQGLPVIIVVVAGGFVTNLVWCLILHFRNGTGYQYLAATARKQSPPADYVAGGGEGAPVHANPALLDGTLDRTPVPLVWNYLFSGLAGTVWYFQFFFYSMGETQMGEYKFSSWTLHMASIIIFATLWGLALKEWKGASAKAVRLITLSIFTLILSTIVVGYGNYLGSGSGGH